MTDAHQEHLELTKWQRTFSRRKQSGRSVSRPDRFSHGRQLVTQVDEVQNTLRRRKTLTDVGINPKLIFKLILHPKGNLSAEQLSQIGLQVLGIDANHAIVVFPSQANIAEFQRRLMEYAGLVPDGHIYANLSAIEEITELTPEDRTGVGLIASPLTEGEIDFLDIELWHSGNSEECHRNIDEIRAYLDTD